MSKPKFLEKEFARPDGAITAFRCHETPQIWIWCFQGGDRELHQFLKMESNQKKPIKTCIFDLLSWHFRWQSEWNSNCTILRFHVIKSNVLPRKLSYENLQSWHSLPTSQSTNCFLHQFTDLILNWWKLFHMLWFSCSMIYQYVIY